MTFEQCWTNVEDVSSILHKWFTNVLCLVGTCRLADFHSVLKDSEHIFMNYITIFICGMATYRPLLEHTIVVYVNINTSTSVTHSRTPKHVKATQSRQNLLAPS